MLYQYRYVISSRNISVVVISTEYFSNWKRLSLYTVPRKQSGVFLVSNLRLSNSLFSTLQPAESSRRAGAEARSQVFSKITEDTLDTQRENKRREARRNKKETERKRKRRSRRREAVSLKEKQLLFGESVSCVRCLMIDLGHMDNLYNQYHHFHSIKLKEFFHKQITTCEDSSSRFSTYLHDQKNRVGGFLEEKRHRIC